MAEDILVHYIAREPGLEVAGRIGLDASMQESLAAVRPDVVVVGAARPLTEHERARLLAIHPDLLLVMVASDERSTCACSKASPQDVLRSIQGGLHAESQ